MYKIRTIVSSPLLTESGYGKRSLDLVKALIKIRPEWDIFLLSQRWGSLPFTTLEPTEENQEVLKRIVPPEEAFSKPVDILIMVTMPNEVPQQRAAKFTIVFTAGVEGSVASSELLLGSNRADLTIFSSTFAEKVFKESKFSSQQGELKLVKPTAVLFEGVDTNIFKPGESTFDLNSISEGFAFLTVGHWLPGEFINGESEDRKRIGTLVKVFLETFKNRKEKPALILKTSSGGFSITEREQLLDKIDYIRKTVNSKDLPNIYVLFGELTDEEMANLYRHPKVKSFVLTSNEGYGRPFAEFAAASNKPIASSPYSGHMDFLKPEFNMLVGGSLKPIHPSAQNAFLIKEGQWYAPDSKQLSLALMEMYLHYSKYVDNGKRQGYLIRNEFNLDKMAEKLDKILTEHVPKISVPVEIKLPKIGNIKYPQKDLVDTKE